MVGETLMLTSSLKMSIASPSASMVVAGRPSDEMGRLIEQVSIELRPLRAASEKLRKLIRALRALLL